MGKRKRKRRERGVWRRAEKWMELVSNDAPPLFVLNPWVCAFKRKNKIYRTTRLWENDLPKDIVQSTTVCLLLVNASTVSMCTAFASIILHLTLQNNTATLLAFPSPQFFDKGRFAIGNPSPPLFSSAGNQLLTLLYRPGKKGKQFSDGGGMGGGGVKPDKKYASGFPGKQLEGEFDRNSVWTYRTGQKYMGKIVNFEYCYTKQNQATKSEK